MIRRGIIISVVRTLSTYLQINIFPLHNEIVSSVQVPNFRLVVVGRVKVGHEGGNVLGGRKPRMDIIPGVEKASRCYCDVLHFMTIEREPEEMIR